MDWLKLRPLHLHVCAENAGSIYAGVDGAATGLSNDTVAPICKGCNFLSISYHFRSETLFPFSFFRFLYFLYLKKKKKFNYLNDDHVL